MKTLNIYRLSLNNTCKTINNVYNSKSKVIYSRGGKKMNKKFNETKFKNLINFTEGFTRVLFFIAIGAATICLLAFVVLMVLPTSVFDSGLNSFNIEIGKTLTYVLEYDLSSGKSLKLLAISAVMAGFAYLLYISFLLFAVKKVMIDVKKDDPFSQSNVKNIFIIAYTIIVGSVLLPLISAGFGAVIMNQIGIEAIEVQMSIDVNMLFFGLLLIVLANIFQYGAYLQNEYDQTV